MNNGWLLVGSWVADWDEGMTKGFSLQWCSSCVDHVWLQDMTNHYVSSSWWNIVVSRIFMHILYTILMLLIFMNWDFAVRELVIGGLASTVADNVDLAPCFFHEDWTFGYFFHSRYVEVAQVVLFMVWPIKRRVELGTKFDLVQKFWTKKTLVSHSFPVSILSILECFGASYLQ